jgi:outer membrane protein assembly factor BamB
MYYWIISVFLILFSIVISAENIPNEPFHSKRYHFNLDQIPTWNISIAPYQKSLILEHPEIPATINVTGYRFETPITANGLQKVRMGRLYDGWIHLMERPGSDFETKKANVQTSYLAVYTKDILNNQMESLKQLTGEYYFVTGNYAYTITVSTLQKYWIDVKPTLKDILDHFWVGTGPRPIPKKHIIRPPSLQRSGYDVQNRNFVIASPNIHRMLIEQKSWEFTLPDHTLIQPVIMDDIVVLALPNRILGISMHTFDTKWEFTLPYSINVDLIAHHGLVTFIQKQPQTELISIDIQTGEIIYKASVNAPTSPLTVYHDQIIMSAKDTLLSFNAFSRQLNWKKSISIDESMKPIITKDAIIIASTSGKLTAVDIKQGRIKWTYPSKHKLKHPILSSNGHIIIITAIATHLDRVIAIDREAGNKKWQFDSPLDAFQITNTPVADTAQLYLVATSKIKSDTLIAIDIQNGTLNWQKEINRPLFHHRPIVLPNVVLLISNNQYWIFDSITGEFFKSQIQKNILLEQYAYQDFILQWQKDNQRYIFSIYK